MSKASNEGHWVVSKAAFDRALNDLEQPAAVTGPLRDLATSVAAADMASVEPTTMKRRPGRLACPVCKREADGQPEYREGIRVFQSFICDTPDCPVGSFRIEWRAA